MGPFVGILFALGQCLVALLAGPRMAETVYLASLIFHLAGASMGFGILVFGRSDPGGANVRHG
jgi:hypothetical protein